MGGVGLLLAKALAIAVVIHSPCPGMEWKMACAERPNIVYYDMDDWPSARDRVDTMRHELGHIIDYNFLTNSDRGMFEAIMHDSRPWVSPPNSPNEQFAEAVMLCARSTRRPVESAGVRYVPTMYQHRKVCRLLAQVAAR